MTSCTLRHVGVGICVHTVAYTCAAPQVAAGVAEAYAFHRQLAIAAAEVEAGPGAAKRGAAGVLRPGGGGVRCVAAGVLHNPAL